MVLTEGGGMARTAPRSLLSAALNFTLATHSVANHDNGTTYYRTINSVIPMVVLPQGKEETPSKTASTGASSIIYGQVT